MTVTFLARTTPQARKGIFVAKSRQYSNHVQAASIEETTAAAQPTELKGSQRYVSAYASPADPTSALPPRNRKNADQAIFEEINRRHRKYQELTHRASTKKKQETERHWGRLKASETPKTPINNYWKTPQQPPAPHNGWTFVDRRSDQRKPRGQL